MRLRNDFFKLLFHFLLSDMHLVEEYHKNRRILIYKITSVTVFKLDSQTK